MVKYYYNFAFKSSEYGHSVTLGRKKSRRYLYGNGACTCFLFYMY